MSTEALLNSLVGVPFEKWHLSGIRLKAVSACADGLVNSGILASGQYFYRKRDKGGLPIFVMEKQ